MLDCAHDHDASGAGVTECIVMFVPNAEELAQHVQPMTGQFGLGTLGNANAIEPRRPNYITLMDRAGGAERALVEEGMRNRDPACQMSIDGRVYIAEGRRSGNMITGDPVDAGVER